MLPLNVNMPGALKELLFSEGNVPNDVIRCPEILPDGLVGPFRSAHLEALLRPIIEQITSFAAPVTSDQPR